MTIALATCREFPQLHISDTHLLEPFARHDIAVDIVCWDDSHVDWSRYAAVIVRSTWDYHRQIDAFRAWIAHLEACDVPLFNPPHLLRWNLDKTYLRVLQDRGVSLLPMVFVDEGESVDVAATLHAQGWQEAVIKPVISAGGDDTWRITAEDAALSQARFDALAQSRGMMIQVFAPQIAQGEWSLVFIGGDYSHAVLKRPAQDEMFVHEERGGTTHAATPPPDFITQAEALVREVQHLTERQPLYARVDGVVIDGAFVLMELECVEPELFFQYVPPAAERFVAAVQAALV